MTVGLLNVVFHLWIFIEVINKKYTYYSGKDCTNFASQVLFAGGAPKDSTWKPYTATWTAAHNFTVYWYSRSNSQYATGSFNSLTANCSPGDFIIGDWERDGRYNHVAFVVGVVVGVGKCWR